MLLATDLDGTFLGGKMQDRLELYRMIRQNPKIKLVFVTGRGIETVIPLLNNPIIPTPDYVISDVGSTIVNGHTLENVEPLQSQIEAKWPHIYGLEAQILKIEGISKQEVPQQRRSSYYYTVDSDLTAIHAIAQENDLDLITS
ncbi:MAG TPA: HAD family hydrolase, partial [Sphingobacterium sp.]|nr:HAD family hydrolase [Sphingobacterium sp.]